MGSLAFKEIIFIRKNKKTKCDYYTQNLFKHEVYKSLAIAVLSKLSLL